MVNEKQGFSLNGYVALLILVIATIASFSLVISNTMPINIFELGNILLLILVGVCYGGFFMVQPNQGKV